MSQEILKEKHLAVLENLKGLTVTEAREIISIVLEDIASNAIIGDKNFV